MRRDWKEVIRGFFPVAIGTAPARRSHVFDAAESPGEGGLIAEAGQRRNLYQSRPGLRQQVLGTLDPKLD